VRSGRPSFTADLVASLRALYAELPPPYRLAEDEIAADLVPRALALPARAAARVPAVTPVLHRGLAKLTLGLSLHVPLRSRAVDDAVRDAVRAGATELVILGAGLDARALRMEELREVRVFEVDHPSTQRHKLTRLGSAPRPPRARALVRVPVDFEADRLDEALVRAGHDPGARAVFVMEGVSVYLTRAALADTLRRVAVASAPGSRLAITYAAPEIAELPRVAMPVAKAFLAAVGEPTRTQLDREEMAALLEAEGFRVIEDTSTADWAARYWPWEERVPVIERLAVAER
jgi:methyltransferase (TIGR00027 family)